MVAIGERRTDCDATLATLCTGTLIAPRVVLTAAHCFAGRGPTTQYETFQGAGAISNAGELHHVVEISLHPNYDPTTHAADLALLLLDSPSAAASVRLRTASVDATLVGQSLRVVGFGGDAPASGSGTKRQGASTITAVDANTITYAPGPALTCAGDSGGPGLLTDGSGEALAGVTAAGDATCTQFGLDVRVDLFVANFIQPFVDSAAQLPPPRAPTIALAQICDSPCGSDDECPSGLVCGPARLCVLGAEPAGNFAATCAGASDCASCMRLDPIAAASSCRCYTPCSSISPPKPGSGGCAIANQKLHTAPLALLLIALAAVLIRNRRIRPFV